MFRQQPVLLHWRARKELIRMMPACTGRRRYEPRLGTRWLMKKMTQATEFRVTGAQKAYLRSVARVGVSAAAMEHGSDWASASKDLARQNVVMSARTMHLVAQYEPLAFRCLMELASSNIPPPPPPDDYVQARDATVDEQLRSDVARLLRPRSALQGSGDTTTHRDAPVVAEWADSWREFDVAGRK